MINVAQKCSNHGTLFTVQCMRFDKCFEATTQLTFVSVCWQGSPTRRATASATSGTQGQTAL